MRELSVEAAAVQLGTSANTIRRKVKQGKIQSRHDDDGRLVIILPDIDTQASVDASNADTHHDSQVVNTATQVSNAETGRLRGLLEAAQRHQDSLETMIGTLHEQLSAQRRQFEAQIERQQRQIDALNQQLSEQRREHGTAVVTHEQAESELRQLLLQAQLQLQAVLPKLMPPEEPEQPRKTWWRWW